MNAAIQSLSCAESIKCRLEEYLAAVSQALGGQLLGIYIFGSLARGCFNETTSDIDLMVISDSTCSPDAVSQISTAHQRLALAVDAVFISSQQVNHNSVPTPIDFLLKPEGSIIRKAAGSLDFIINRQDVYDCGIAVFGPEAKHLVKAVPWELQKEAITQLYPFVIARFKNPVLMLCRMVYALCNQQLCSKVAAGKWALSAFAAEWSQLINRGLAEYCSGVTANNSNKDTLNQFGRYCSAYIKDHQQE